LKRTLAALVILAVSAVFRAQEKPAAKPPEKPAAAPYQGMGPVIENVEVSVTSIDVIVTDSLRDDERRQLEENGIETIVAGQGDPGPAEA